MSAFSSEQLKQLRAFIDLCKVKPSILHLDDFKFFKDYIESLGGSIPAAGAASTDDFIPKPQPKSEPQPAPQPEPQPQEESEESEVELDNDGVIGKQFF